MIWATRPPGERLPPKHARARRRHPDALAQPIAVSATARAIAWSVEAERAALGRQL
jgi:hypothetical protein